MLRIIKPLCPQASLSSVGSPKMTVFHASPRVFAVRLPEDLGCQLDGNILLAQPKTRFEHYYSYAEIARVLETYIPIPFFSSPTTKRRDTSSLLIWPVRAYDVSESASLAKIASCCSKFLERIHTITLMKVSDHHGVNAQTSELGGLGCCKRAKESNLQGEDKRRSG